MPEIINTFPYRFGDAKLRSEILNLELFSDNCVPEFLFLIKSWKNYLHRSILFRQCYLLVV
ncbi:MAG: hypothetical protein M3P47_03815, partial [Pseudomonadota bacterium]|nr:hypothetical protein [Pseudomonadota bacterium]